MRHPIELAARFIRRGEFVLGNDVLMDEYGVEYSNPSQVEYYAIYRDHSDARAINESLKCVAEMYGCLTYLESDADTGRLTLSVKMTLLVFLNTVGGSLSQMSMVMMPS